MQTNYNTSTEGRRGARQRTGPPWATTGLPAVIAALCLLAAGGHCAQNPPDKAMPGSIAMPLSLQAAVDLALRQNASILRSQTDLEAAHGVILQTRAIALPKLRLVADYTYSDAVEEFVVNGTEVINPSHNEWQGDIRLVQTIYQGGSLRSAWRKSDLTREWAMLEHQTVVADTLLEVRTAYYDVLLSAQQIVVREAAVARLRQSLTNTLQRFGAGAVPRLDVLRAEVQLASEEPKLIRAQNLWRLDKGRLAVLLGWNVPDDLNEDLPLNLTDTLVAEPFEIELTPAIVQARSRRPELAALRALEGLRKEDIVTAKSGYKPAIRIYAGYGSHNSGFHDDFFRDVSGPIAGVGLDWEIFNFGDTRGRVAEATARRDRARVSFEDAVRRVEQEVRMASSEFLESRLVLESQQKVQERADEALRLAVSRYDAGSSTQLDVLNAQTALTEARTTQIEALHAYMVAKAKFARAIGQDVPERVETGRLP